MNSPLSLAEAALLSRPVQRSKRIYTSREATEFSADVNRSEKLCSASKSDREGNPKRF